jgi:hypothetical protein
LKYKYTAIFSIKGLKLPDGNSEVSLIDEPKSDLNVILTTDSDPHTFELDLSLAIMNLIFRGKISEDILEQRLKIFVDEMKVNRKNKYGKNPFLVITFYGDDLDFNPKHLEKFGNYFISIDEIDKEKLQNIFEKKITAVLNAIILISNSVFKIEKLNNAIVFISSDNELYFPYNISAGIVSAYISKPLNPDQIEEIWKTYNKLESDVSLESIQRLNEDSTLTNDRLRSFLFAWMALEIFIHKVFSIYESKIFSMVLKENQAEIRRKFIERIKEVMKDKYRLADKFSAISVLLSPSTSEVDLQIFKDVKKIRDSFTHSGLIDEDELPTEKIRSILNKYLRLHLSNH